MSEPIPASEAKQIMDILKELQGDMKRVQSELQALTLEVRVNQSKSNEQFNTVRAEIKAINDKVDGLRSELRDDINELRTQQRATDARLWAFIVGLVTLVGSGVIKVLWFDRA
ncbi:hemagglutinin [Parathermosynechococcus lividus]